MGELHEKVMSKTKAVKPDPAPAPRKKPTPVFVPRMGPDYDDESDLEQKQKDLPPVYKSHWR